MRPDPLVPVQPHGVPSGAAFAWADGGRFMLPVRLVERSGLAARRDGHGRLSLNQHGWSLRADDAEELRLRNAFTENPPASSRLPFSYRLIPGALRRLAASIIGRIRRRQIAQWAHFPGWPLDLSADFLADLASGARSPFADGPTPVLLTHDLDSAEGLENLVQRFLPIEESLGARSTSFVVPCAWPLDYELLDEVKRRGHDIGVHGYDHSNRTPYAQPEERRRRIEAGRRLAERYGAIGYRAPSLVRTRALLRDLASQYEYDSSIPTSGGLFPVPNNGCASARPFVIEGITEIPVSMPRDGSLLFLGYDASSILSLWIECAEAISRAGGVVVLLTHCEQGFSGGPAMLAAYRGFLEHVSRTKEFCWSTPQQVLARCRTAAPAGRGSA
jgi:peptidoglycan/xylan/chitin deacetylase (PgdA/CDA1 family)